MLNYIYKYTFKCLTKGKFSKKGRNFLGRVCTIGRGGGNKRLYRFINFIRRINFFGIIFKVLYDPNRTSRICFVLFKNGLIACLLKIEGQKRGTLLYCGINLKEKIVTEINFKLLNGYSLPLKEIKLFTVVSNIEKKPFQGGTLCRVGGGGCMFYGKDDSDGFLKLRSGWHIKVPIECMASIGKIGKKNLRIIGSAGKNRGLGFRPKVRGVAKNPCDHPHGGGNGKKAKPPVPRNAWSTVFKWEHTKKKKNEKLKRYKLKTIFE